MLAQWLPGPKERNGTVAVDVDLSLPGHPEVFVIGDLAAARGKGGQPLPQLAQVAIQGGRHAAAAGLPGGITLRGTPGWVAWLAVHLVFLIGFRNRLVVLLNWAWNHLAWDRASRVILQERRGEPSGGTA